MQKKRLHPVFLLLPAVLFVVAGAVPLFGGGDVNSVFIALGAVWMVIGLAAVKKQRADVPPSASLPPDAPN